MESDQTNSAFNKLFQRIHALIRLKAKIPGWIMVGWALFQIIPDWKGRCDFWLDAAKKAGGLLGEMANILLFPYFTPLVALVGVGWLIFVGEPTKQIRLGRWLIVLGYAGVTLLFAAFLTVGVKGYFEDQVNKEITKRQITERHLTQNQISELTKELTPISGQFTKLITVAAEPDPEATGYAIEIMQTLLSSQVPVQSVSERILAPMVARMLDTSIHGIFFQVKDISNPPKQVSTLINVFAHAQIQVDLMPNTELDDEGYVLTVANK